MVLKPPARPTTLSAITGSAKNETNTLLLLTRAPEVANVEASWALATLK